MTEVGDKQFEDQLDTADAQLAELEYANQLAFEREQIQLETSSLLETARSFVGPSLFKYGLILLLFAVPNDLVDALELTGFLSFLSWFISMFLSITTIFITWFSDSELKRVKAHMANREKYQKALAKTATQTAAKLTKFAPKNPVTKVIAGAILEMIPYISILPWSSISVMLAYQDEKKTYKEARKSAEESASAVLTEQPV